MSIVKTFSIFLAFLLVLVVVGWIVYATFQQEATPSTTHAPATFVEKIKDMVKPKPPSLTKQILSEVLSIRKDCQQLVQWKILADLVACTEMLVAVGQAIGLKNEKELDQLVGYQLTPECLLNVRMIRYALHLTLIRYKQDKSWQEKSFKECKMNVIKALDLCKLPLTNPSK